MKFNVTFTLRTPDGRFIDVPNIQNPVDAENLSSILASLGSRMPRDFCGVRVVGVHVEEVGRNAE